MQEINAALTAATALLGIARGALDARDDVKVRQALTDVQQRLFEATSAALDMAVRATALQEAVRDAQDEVRVLKAQAQEREAHALAEIRPGAYAYARKPTDGGENHAPPYFCQPCYDKGVKAIFRFHQAGPGSNASWRCPVDGAHNIGVPDTAKPYPRIDYG